MNKFENFLTEKNDEIDNAAFALIQALAGEEAEWDMEIIGDIVDFADVLLIEHGYEVCHPYYEGDDRTACYKGKDCTNVECPLRNKSIV